MIELEVHGEDPLLDGLMTAARNHVGADMRHLVAVELRDLAPVLGPLSALRDWLRSMGAVIVVDGVELRETGAGGEHRFMPVFRCRHCSGGRCARCQWTGERRGRR